MGVLGFIEDSFCLRIHNTRLLHIHAYRVGIVHSWEQGWRIHGMRQSQRFIVHILRYGAWNVSSPEWNWESPLEASMMTFTPTCSGIDEMAIGCLSSHSFLDKGCLFSTIHVDSHKCEILSMRLLGLLLWFSKYWRSSIHNCEYEWIEDYFIYRMQYKSKRQLVHMWRKRQG